MQEPLTDEELAKRQEESKKRAEVHEELRRGVTDGLLDMVRHAHKLDPEKRALVLREAAVAFAALEDAKTNWAEARARMGPTR